MNTVNSNHISVYNEYSLHAQLKDRYCGNLGEKEKKIGKYFIDVVKKDELIEIQTQNFSQIKPKILSLLKSGYNVRLVYPLVYEKRSSTTFIDSTIKMRKSPKKSNLFNVFNELVYFTEIFSYSGFKLEVLMISILEEQIQVHQKFRKRKKYRVVNRRLLEIKNSFVFGTVADFLFLLPRSLPKLFSTLELQEILEVNYQLSAKIIYVLKRLKLIEQVGKQGNRKYYQKTIF